MFSDMVCTFINDEIGEGVGERKQSLSQIQGLGSSLNRAFWHRHSVKLFV